MTLPILIAFVVIVLIMAYLGRQPLAWEKRMKRVPMGKGDQIEWMAPDEVVVQVKLDYLAAMRWLPESLSQSWSSQWIQSPHFFSGLYLKRHQELLKHYRIDKPLRYIGVLRCVHDVSVRHFSDDGLRCLVLDHQTERRMATYHVGVHERLNTQDLGDGTFVYEMAYDKQARGWKIDRYIQELPLGWSRQRKSLRVNVLTGLPDTIGRDN